MRDYLYISDAKVDMYLPQVSSRDKKKIAANLGFNVGVLKGGVSVEQRLLTDRVHRLNAVEPWLRVAKSVGPIDSNEPWIEGTVSVAAATLKDLTGKDHKDVMFFFSNSETHFLGLAGSAHHVIGNVRPETAVSSYTHAHTLLETLRGITTSYAFVVDKSDPALSHHVHMAVTQTGNVSSWARIMDEISTQFDEAPHQTVTFLARRLLSDTFEPNGKRYTLATPLYMTLEDVVVEPV